ncbi:MAG: Ig-like domain-containing protein [Candidatus Magasanikbacteria bacterium]
MLQCRNYNSKRLKKIAIIAGAIFVAVFFVYFVRFSPTVALAQGLPTTTAGEVVQEGLQVIQEPLGLPATDIRIIIARVIRVALSLIGIIMLCLILYGGFLWMTAGGNDEQIGQAKKVIRNAVIGLAIILSAYMIVQFVFKILGFNTISVPPGKNPPVIMNLTGSGALGRIVKDHYPMRDQKDVSRNTKIVITFFRPIKLDESWIEKKAESVKPLGSCKTIIANYKTDCDQLILNPTKIDVLKITRVKNPNNTYTITETSIGTTTNPNYGAAIMATAVGGVVDTIVIRPNDALGSPSEDVTYKVIIGNDIKWNDAKNGDPSIFRGFPEQNYYWNFTCNTQIDSSPPFVTDVFPGDGKVEYKNTEIQVTFNEPVDPTGIQGEFMVTSTGGYSSYYLPGNNVYLLIQPLSSSFDVGEGFPSGTVKLTGNYRILTFTPSAVCGTNACGQPMYCLPTPALSTSIYTMMIRAAQTTAPAGSKNFESIPFTGVSDMASNALDTGPAVSGKVGRHNGVVETAPRTDPWWGVVPEAPDNLGQLAPDNYWWGFKIKDEMDLKAPYLRQIAPGIDAENISATQTWKMVFSKRMRPGPLYDITITEYPDAERRCKTGAGAAIKGCIPIPLWKVPYSPVYSDPVGGLSERFVTTSVTMMHGLFIKETQQYYIPELTSAIEDVGFNCFYPGLGPGGSEEISAQALESGTCYNENGTIAAGDHCCDVTAFPTYNAYCCNGEVNNTGEAGNPVHYNTSTCKQFIKDLDTSVR